MALKNTRKRAVAAKLAVLLALVLCLTCAAAWADRDKNDDQESGAPASVVSVELPAGAAIGFKTPIVVRSTPAARVLQMCNSQGKVVKTWKADADSAVKDGVRIWKVSHEFVRAARQTLRFRVSADGRTFDEGLTAQITIGVMPVTGVALPEVVMVSSEARFTVQTPEAARYLRMYNSDGVLIKTWKAKGSSSAAGGMRTWDLSYTFKRVAAQTLSFSASADEKTWGESVQARIIISGLPEVKEVRMPAAVTTGADTVITVKTSAGALFLRMLNAQGKTVQTWPAEGNSSLQGEDRIWTVHFAFQSVGAKTLTFEASVDKKTFGAGKEVRTAVAPVLVTRVEMPPIASIGVATPITVKTTAGARYLQLLNTQGTVIKTWEAEGNSTLSGQLRVWGLSYEFVRAAQHSLTFRASTDGKTFSGPVVVHLNAVEGFCITMDTTVLAAGGEVRAHEIAVPNGRDTLEWALTPGISWTVLTDSAWIRAESAGGVLRLSLEGGDAERSGWVYIMADDTLYDFCLVQRPAGGTGAQAPATDVRAVPAEAGAVRVEWSAAAGAEGYRVYWSTGFDAALAGDYVDAGAADSSATLPGLDADTKYYVWVQARGADGAYAWGTCVAVTTAS